METFLTRFASGEKGLWLAGYRSSNRSQSTITFSKKDRLTLGPQFVRIIDSIRSKSLHLASRTTPEGKSTDDLVKRQELSSQNVAPIEDVSASLEKELEIAANQIEREYLNKPGEDVDVIVKRRIGQGPFRTLLQKTYGTSCWLSGLADTRLLIASHIVPWSKSLPSQKTDPENGLLLSVSWDALFDKGYISFDEFGNLLCSDLLNEATTKCLGISKQSALSKNLMTEPRKQNLAWHRKQHGFEE